MSEKTESVSSSRGELRGSKEFETLLTKMNTILRVVENNEVKLRTTLRFLDKLVQFALEGEEGYETEEEEEDDP